MYDDFNRIRPFLSINQRRVKDAVSPTNSEEMLDISNGLTI